MKLYIFWTDPLSIIRSFFAVHTAMVYVIQVFRQLLNKPAWHILLLCVQWKNSWWWTEELSERCRVSFQNKFEKSVHLVGFIKKKFGCFGLSALIWKHMWVTRSQAVTCWPAISYAYGVNLDRRMLDRILYLVDIGDMPW